MPDATDLTPDAKKHRQHIFQTGLSLITSKGYDTISLEDIAKTAEVSLEDVTTYFPRKEDIVMALYKVHADEITVFNDNLPRGQMADRFAAVLRYTLEGLTPYRSAIMALFGASMNPESGVSIMGVDSDSMRSKTETSFHQLVLESADSLREPKAEQMGTVLYTVYLLMILFWLYDRTPQQRATHELVGFLHETFRLMRPMFLLPMIPRAIGRLAEIVSPLFHAEANRSNE